MTLSDEHRELLKKLMVESAKKGNLANSGLVLEGEEMIASAESLVASDCNATAHSERMLVEIAGHLKKTNFTPGLVMVSVVEPCVMCMSACSQAGFAEIAYIIPAKRYVEKIPWITDGIKIDKQKLAGQFTQPIKLSHLALYEEEFVKVFEAAMARFLY